MERSRVVPLALRGALTVVVFGLVVIRMDMLEIADLVLFSLLSLAAAGIWRAGTRLFRLLRGEPDGGS